ncbi:MAG: endonuclease Q family protein [Patescibacteria group bacterium]
MAEYIADLHVHSHHSREASKQMTLEQIAEWSTKKGLAVVAAADFTNSEWYQELQKKLLIQENGLYKLKEYDGDIKFILSAEVTCAFTKKERGRRINLLIIAPNFQVADEINSQLSWISDIKSQGLPTVEIEAEELVRIVMEASPDSAVIPANVWETSSSLFSTRDGFDKIDECFAEMVTKIGAIESGLASDPPMNWRLSQLDDFRILSFSGAREPEDMGREATIFSLSELTYSNIIKAIQQPTTEDKVSSTIEQYPELHEFYLDGHQSCHIRFTPEESDNHSGNCPTCQKPLTRGVMSRLEELANRPANIEKPDNRPPYRHVVPLLNIIAEARESKKKDKAVIEEYNTIIASAGPELKILTSDTPNQYAGAINPKILEGIKRTQAENINVTPGYADNKGVVNIFSPDEGVDKAGQDRLL